MNAFATSAVVTLALIAMEAAKRHVRYRIKIKSIKTKRHEKRVRTCQRIARRMSAVT
jgi:energy-converting hydrogenase Eha subunit B